MNPLSRQPRKMVVHLHVRYLWVHSRHGHRRKESHKTLSCTRSERDFVNVESNVYIQGMLRSVFMVKQVILQADNLAESFSDLFLC